MKNSRLTKNLIKILILTLVIALCLPALTVLGAENEGQTSDGQQSDSSGFVEEEYVDTADFTGKKIGVITGSVYATRVYDLFINPKVHFYETASDGVVAVHAGKVDAFLDDTLSLSYYSSKNDYTVCKAIYAKPDYFAFATAKTSKGKMLVDDFNSYLADITESGKLDAFREKWFEGTEDDRVMEEYEELPATNGSLIIATAAEYPPFEYMKDNMTVGYEIELIVDYCRERGLRPEMRDVNFDGIFAGLGTGKYDIAVAGLSITKERKESVYFTDPILENEPGIAIKADKDEKNVLSAQGIESGFDRTFINEQRWKAFVNGIVVTLKITLLSILFGTLLGFFTYAVCRKGSKYAIIISTVVRAIIHGLPAVVFLMVMYYIVFGHSSIGGETVAIIVFTLIFACTMHGLFEEGERDLDPGQRICAKAMGYSEQKTFFKIILPQVAKDFMPAFLTAISGHIQATAIVGYIAVVDLTKVGDLIRGATYQAFFPLISVAALYFLMATVLKLGVMATTKNLNPENRTQKKILKGAKIKG